MLSLHSLLEKLNLSYDKLTEEEKKTYESWNQVFTQPDVSIKDLKKFLPVQIEFLQNQIDDYKLKDDTPKALYLKACLRNLKMITAFVTGPEKRREWLEKHIEQRIK
jgi:hypothetical protein